METGDPLVTADWLKQNISAPDIRIVDATWFAPFMNPEKSGREAWAEAHIPGAVYFDIDEIADEASDLPHMMPDAVKFSSRVRKLGIGGTPTLIADGRLISGFQQGELEEFLNTRKAGADGLR